MFSRKDFTFYCLKECPAWMLNARSLPSVSLRWIQIFVVKAYFGEIRNAYKIVVGDPERQMPLLRRRLIGGTEAK